MSEVTRGERRLLALERVWDTIPGAELHRSTAPPEYCRLVAELIEREQSEEYEPIVTEFLRRRCREETSLPGSARPAHWMPGVAAAMVATI